MTHLFQVGHHKSHVVNDRSYSAVGGRALDFQRGGLTLQIYQHWNVDWNVAKAVLTLSSDGRSYMDGEFVGG